MPAWVHLVTSETVLYLAQMGCQGFTLCGARGDCHAVKAVIIFSQHMIPFLAFGSFAFGPWRRCTEKCFTSSFSTSWFRNTTPLKFENRKNAMLVQIDINRLTKFQPGLTCVLNKNTNIAFSEIVAQNISIIFKFFCLQGNCLELSRRRQTLQEIFLLISRGLLWKHPFIHPQGCVIGGHFCFNQSINRSVY